MFCPTCGKDNSPGVKFCASCGTNLETVAQALTARQDDFFTKMDIGIDQFVARYSEHVFRNAPHTASERTVKGSWQILGQGVVTSLVDLLLFTLMWNLLPLRFLILLISTPFRLLAERGESGKRQPEIAHDYEPPQLTDAPARLWRDELPPSVTEDTTVHLKKVTTAHEASPTDRLK